MAKTNATRATATQTPNAMPAVSVAQTPAASQTWQAASQANYTHVVVTGIAPAGKMGTNTAACLAAHCAALGLPMPAAGVLYTKAQWQGFASALPTLGAALGWPAANAGHALGSNTLGSNKRASVRGCYKAQARQAALPWALVSQA
jgi:hypothetical protein